MSQLKPATPNSFPALPIEDISSLLEQPKSLSKAAKPSQFNLKTFSFLLGTAKSIFKKKPEEPKMAAIPVSKDLNRSSEFHVQTASLAAELNTKKLAARQRLLSVDAIIEKDHTAENLSSEASHHLLPIPSESRNNGSLSQIPSTESDSSDGHTFTDDNLKTMTEQESAEYLILRGILETSQLQQEEGESKLKAQNILIESYCRELDLTQKAFQKIPCLASADSTKFYVFMNKMTAEKFTRSTLENISMAAEQTSPACQQLVFIAARKGSSEIEANYKKMKGTFEVIDAERMKKQEIAAIVRESSLEQALREFGFYSMQI